jgi:hypothetical protein
MEVSDLASMPPGRAVVFPSGIPATMIKTVPWMAGPNAAAVRASIAHHDPGATGGGASAAGGSGANAWVAAGNQFSGTGRAPEPVPQWSRPAPGTPVWNTGPQSGGQGYGQEQEFGQEQEGQGRGW